MVRVKSFDRLQTTVASTRTSVNTPAKLCPSFSYSEFKRQYVAERINGDIIAGQNGEALFDFEQPKCPKSAGLSDIECFVYDKDTIRTTIIEATTGTTAEATTSTLSTITTAADTTTSVLETTPQAGLE